MRASLSLACATRTSRFVHARSVKHSCSRTIMRQRKQCIGTRSSVSFTRSGGDDGACSGETAQGGTGG